MKLKFFLGFALFGLSLASAKSYEINVDTVTKAGDVQLQPGAYRVSLNGSTVKFTNEQNGKSVQTNANVQTSAPSKYQATALETAQENGVTTVHEIDLGGTKTKVLFNKSAAAPNLTGQFD